MISGVKLQIICSYQNLKGKSCADVFLVGVVVSASIFYSFITTKSIKNPKPHI
jgi:hypothetical protein